MNIRSIFGPFCFLMLIFLFEKAGFSSESFKSSNSSSLFGVYKFKEEAINWKDRGRENDIIEQILEIVPYQKDRIYFRFSYEDPLRPKLYGFWGIAVMNSNGFIYKYLEDNKVYTFQISKQGSDVELRWVGEIPSFYEWHPVITFPYAKQRPIKYLNKIFQSRQYKEAVAEESKDNKR